MSNKFGLTFGCDPEYFLVEKDASGNEWGVPLPYLFEEKGYPIVEVDEEWKHPVLHKEDTYKVHMDGIACELGVAPSTSAKEMFSNLKSAMNYLEDVAYNAGLEMSYKPTVKYDFNKWYKQSSRLFSWCGIFGCDPDQDAVEEDYNSPVIDVEKHGYRYGGGHLHISDDNNLLDKYPLPMIRLLAVYVGTYTIANSPYPELEKQRAFRYGQPGRYRVQHYPNGVTGIEYRSPSNVWTSDEGLVEGVIEQATKAYSILPDREKAVSVMKEFLPSAITAIKNCDQSLARSILSAI